MRPIVKEIENTEVIIDYNDTDFRTFWKGKVEEILHKQESRIIANTPFEQQGWFLDLGCGHGRLISSYYHQDRNIICVDYAINHLQMAAESFPQENITFIAADANHLPFKNGSFSSGISIRLLHHMTNENQFLTEISRIYHKGAILLLSFMNNRNLLRILKYGLPCFKKAHIQTANVIYATHPVYIRNLLIKFKWKIQKNQGAGMLYQFSRMTSKVEKIVSSCKFISKCFEYTDIAFNYLLGKLNLALMQYLELKLENNKQANDGYKTLNDILQCPQCQSDALKMTSANILCSHCQANYPIEGGIIDFRI